MESTLGKRISSYRKLLGLTQEQLAEKLGITAQAVSKWENDISCPDITMLPKLADIFSVTTDTLLGREVPITACNKENVADQNSPGSEFEYNSDIGKIRIHLNNLKSEGFGLACWVLVTGAVYLIAQLLHMDIAFWDVVWPTFLLVFGLFGIYPRFSVFRLACSLVGSYFLAIKLQLFQLQLDKEIVFALLILLFGLSLLFEVFRKNRRKYFNRCIKQHGSEHRSKIAQDYSVNGNSFTYDASFGSSNQLVKMDTLAHGTISTNFGEYTVDLRGVASVEPGCRIHADCSFGELTILVPVQYCVLPDSSTSFASFEIKGSPDTVSKEYRIQHPTQPYI